MIPSPTRRVWHSLGKAIVAGFAALMMVAVTYDGQVGRTLATEEVKNGLTLGTAYAQEGEGLDIGAGLDIVGGLTSFLYYAFDKSYIDKFYGGNVGGFILNFLITGGDTEGVELDYIINQLSVLNQQINHVIRLEVQIEKEIKALAEEVNIDANEIKQQIDNSVMVPAITGINRYAGSGFLTSYLNSSIKNITDTDRQNIKNTCYAPILHESQTTNAGPVGAWLTTMNEYIMAGNNLGLIQLLANHVKLSVNSGNDPYKAYRVMEGYFLKYVLIQAKGINLYINCAHTMSPLAPLSTEIQTNYITYLTNIVTQFKAFRAAVENTVTLNTNYSLTRGAYNTVSGSTSGMVAGGVNNSTGNILPRVDFVIDRALGSPDLALLLTHLKENSTEFLKNPRGALTARFLTFGSDTTPNPLTFSYDGPGYKQVVPPIKACPQSLQRTAVWKLVNASPNRLIIPSLAGWLRKGQGQFESHPSQVNTYLGTPSYQLAVSDILLNPGEMGSIGLCASAFGAKEPDESLYLEYQLLATNTQKPGPAQSIGWSGTGTHVTTNGPFTVDAKAQLIEIQGTPYISDSVSADKLSGLPYLTWVENSTTSVITGQNSSYQMLRYVFSQVPVGSYGVTKSAKEPLTPRSGLYVYMRDRNFNVINPFPRPEQTQNLLLANGQHLETWEIFAFDIAQIGSSGAVGRLLAANGKYLVVMPDAQGHDTLVFNSDIGQNVTFVGWDSKQGEGIINMGYLEIKDKEGIPKRIQVQRNPTTQQPVVTLIAPPTQPTDSQGTKFKITFIDKGKKALVEGSSYKVSLAYGLADVDSPMACPALLSKPKACARDLNPIPASCKCYQYYLFANVGYPYGYFTYSPIAATGGFGKNLVQEIGVSSFANWSFAETRNVVEGCPKNGGEASGGAYKDKPGVWGKITSKSDAGETCVSAGVMAAKVATFNLGSSSNPPSTTAGCEYNFTMSIEAKNSSDFKWNDQDDQYKLTHKTLFLRLDQGDRSKNPWPDTPIKKLSTDLNSSTSSKTWNTSGDLSISHAKNGDLFSILYGLYLAYNDQGVFMTVYPKFTLDIIPSNIELNLTGISGKNCQIGQS